MQSRARIIGATLTPLEGAHLYTLEVEAKRQALNAFVRTSGEFDDVIDFDLVVRDPTRRSFASSRPVTRIRAALWADKAADFVYDPRAALHEDLWRDARAIGDRLGRAARMGWQEPRRPSVAGTAVA